jgi:hypothetical protein
MGIIYYREDDYDRLIGMMEDKELLFERWDQWRNVVENGIERFATEGKLLTRISHTCAVVNFQG